MDLYDAIKKTKEDYKNPENQKIEKEVMDKYGSIFHPKNLDSLTKDEFKSFLLLKNNKHWDGIHRQGNLITQDMNKLRGALKIVLDESKSIKERLDFLFPKNKPSYIKGLGRAIITPILMVVYPTKYGVYNRRSSEGLKKENLYPKVSRGASFSEKYIKINEVLKGLASDNKMTFYELDNIWWHVTEEPSPPPEEEEQETEELSTGFGLEPHLRRFLIDNWENTPLGKKYEILTEDGEIIGEEYPTKEAGNIDILAKDKKSKEWVVIELKKGQSSDAVVGQILRYIGWIERNKIEKDEGVKGIIIVKEIDKKLENALFALKGRIKISCFEYNVQFSLSEFMR